MSPFPAESTEIEVLDELRQRRLPRFLRWLAILPSFRVQAEFASHLHLRVREVVSLARRNPGLNIRRKRLLFLSHTAQHSQ
jgi:hypothetical protein